MPGAAWPSLEEQLDQDNVPQGSPLERLIREHQDFGLLRPEEATDRIGVPPWLRVYWLKQHPDLDYRSEDPTGGYPLALKHVHTWMVTHPNLQPEPDEPTAVAAPSRARASAVTETAAAPGVGPDLRISGEQGTPRSESDIVVNISNTSKIIAGANAPGHRLPMFSSADGGATWDQTHLSLEQGDTSHGDPAVAWSPFGLGTAWAVAMGIQGVNVRLQLRAYRSDDGGHTWNFDGTPSGSQTRADKEMICLDNSVTSPFVGHIYVIWHNDDPAFVNRRPEPAQWSVPVQVSGAETTGTAVGGAITTNSSGDVFAMWPDTGSRSLWVAKSTDGGASFSSPVTIATTFAAFRIMVPSFPLGALIYLSAGAYFTASKDLVYAVWTDLTGVPGCSSSADAPGTDVSSACKTRIWFSRSTDGGATWDAATMINDQPLLNDQFSPRLAVDQADGALVVIYYDTVDDPGRLKTDVWYQSSRDDGVTWSAANTVTTSQTDETAGGADASNQYGEYNGLSGFAGKFFPSWTDRRNGAREEIWTAPITLAALPTVAGISPTIGSEAGGDQVTITGSGFTDAQDAQFGGASVTALNVDSDSQITVASPAGAGTVDVTVITPVGTSATGPADQYTYD
jgi:IPT/TIG domain